MATKIQLRRDTSTAWTKNNPVLALGEPGLETDTNTVKYGDGSSRWNDLPYSSLIDSAKLTTANVVETSNLYFSNARAYANVVAAGFASNSYVNNQFASNTFVNNQLPLKANVFDLTTANVAEVSNLYFTNSRVVSALVGGNNIDIGSNGLVTFKTENVVTQINGTSGNIVLTTTNIPEGTNFYLSAANFSNFYQNIVSNANVVSFVEVSANIVTPTNKLLTPKYTYDQMVSLSGSEGEIIFETSNNLFMGYNGISWVQLG